MQWQIIINNLAYARMDVWLDRKLKKVYNTFYGKLR